MSTKGIVIERNFTKDRNNDAHEAFLNELDGLLDDFDSDSSSISDQEVAATAVTDSSEKSDNNNFMPEKAPSYITEINSYKSKLLLQDFKSNLALPFKGLI